MCRFFAVRANRPTRLTASVVTAPHALRRQSCGDRRGICHDSGWGIAAFKDGEPWRVRSPRAAAADPRFEEVAHGVTATAALAHVRLASSGERSERNCHPFTDGRWLFAHNGTLFGFGTDPDRLRRLLPPHRLRMIDGDTDSEHAFQFLLTRLEPTDADPEQIGRVVAETIGTLETLYPGAGDERTQLNFVLTDGQILVASRVRHTLFRLERRDVPEIPDGDRPAETGPGYYAVAIASEPTTDEPWVEVPDRSVVVVRPDLSVGLQDIP
jgi:glutamine amidotransferase